MATQEPGPLYGSNGNGTNGSGTGQEPGPRVGTVVWGLVIVALAALIIISKLGLIALNANYVLIGLMIGAGAALIIGGLVSARSHSPKQKESDGEPRNGTNHG
ncbi:hypothetical protein [Arthrobacter celericrescens]|uniref:hypothetical protein n=1 Tax=Arthrobacter celericrescens TaxID=2320851 RepID=UPI001FDFD85F|nr:hypothetical protein [Arthrobacter celericrescens]